jgi:hypothetical protein
MHCSAEVERCSPKKGARNLPSPVARAQRQRRGASGAACRATLPRNWTTGSERPTMGHCPCCISRAHVSPSSALCSLARGRPNPRGSLARGRPNPRGSLARGRPDPRHFVARRSPNPRDFLAAHPLPACFLAAGVSALPRSRSRSAVPLRRRRPRRPPRPLQRATRTPLLRMLPPAIRHLRPLPNRGRPLPSPAQQHRPPARRRAPRAIRGASKRSSR